MDIVTIPEKLSRKGELVVLSRKEYETLLKQRVKKTYTEVEAAIKEGLKDYREGRVCGPFKNMKEFKAHLQKKI